MTDTDNTQVSINWNINLNDIDSNIDTQNGNTWENNTFSDSYEGVDLRKVGKDITTHKEMGLSKSTKQIILFSFIIILTCIVWFIFYKYDKYIVDYSNWIEDNSNSVVEFYEKTKKQIYDLIGKDYEKANTSIDLTGEIWTKNLSNLIQSEKGYIYKKEIIKTSLKKLFDEIIKHANELDEAKKQLSTNWFFSSKLWSIISNEESITSIQDSLNAIEAIKFTSAISVFSKLDTFIESLSKEVWIWKEEILTKISKITTRWERDINLYIKNCRLNTFEIDYNCNSVWDFNKYYELTEDYEFDTKFFKKLIQFIDEKLEQTEIPSFRINFRSFNKQSNELTFDIEINTFKEDEVELAKKGILSSHSFILNSLINNLKLSRAIVSEAIEVRTIDVNQRTINVWVTEFTVNTSNKTFSVPIKNENQIEIDDFIY